MSLSTIQVQDAIESQDIGRLRELSLRPGGFGDSRRIAWPFLLRASATQTATQDLHIIEDETSQSEDVPHKDERQVQLDTDRAFVLYPNVRDAEKDRLKARLHRLILSVLKKRRKLSYFQGYHDVIAVLLLTLCPDGPGSKEEEAVLQTCSEKMSLFWLRDAMGPGLEPVLGLLRIVRRLLRLADPSFAKIIEKTTPLPYFALSNLLTMFCHDVPTLPLIQHILDFLISHPPIMTAYLATALILKRRDEVMNKVAEQDEEGAMFVLLGGLPPLVDQAEDELPEDASGSETGPEEKATLQAPESADDSNNDEKRVSEDREKPPPYTPTPYPPLSATPSPTDEKPRGPPISVVSLLQSSITLYTLYPPSTPALKLTSTLGPLSVYYPMPLSSPPISDEEAESYVERPSEVVFPFEDDDEEDDAFKRPRDRVTRREIEMRTLVAVAVLGAGVLLAIYGSEGGLGRVDWRQIGRLVGGIVRDAGERVAGGL